MALVTSKESMGSFAGGEAEFPGWCMYEYMQYLSCHGSIGVSQLPDDMMAYEALASDDPHQWQMMPPNHWPGCPNCYLDPAGNLTHSVPDNGPVGQARRRLKQLDAQAGAAIRVAWKDGRASHPSTNQADQGLASRIMRRANLHYSQAAVRAWERYQNKFDSITVDEGLPQVEQIETWMNDVLKLHQDMVMLANAHPLDLGRLLRNEKMIVGMLRKQAPKVQREATHWIVTKEADDLQTFFEAQLQFARAASYADGDADEPYQAAAASLLANAIPAAVNPKLTAMMAMIRPFLRG